MSDEEYDWRYQHLATFVLEHKDVYLDSAWDIQNSFTGRVDIIGLHRFFIESALEIKNSIKLFESGFIGAAFYSVRVAVELARVVTLFASSENHANSDMFGLWKSGGKFPFDAQIKEKIKASSEVFMEVEHEIPWFFENQAKRLKKMQKYIHKQGFATFYDRGFESVEKSFMRKNRITEDFDTFIKNSIIEISILRVCVDPFPILLNDPEIYRRIHFESMTIPFGEGLMEVIGADIIQLVRSIPAYRSYVESFMEYDELSDEALSVVNDNYYDRGWWNVVSPQMQLLSVGDRVAVSLFQLSVKVSKVYSIGGLHFHFSNVPTKRKNLSWSSETFDSVSDFNVTYDEVFLSHVQVLGQDFWLEHNEPLSETEKAVYLTLNNLQNDEQGK